MRKMFLAVAIIAIVWSCQKTETTAKNLSDYSDNSLKLDSVDPTSSLELEVLVDSSSLQGIINNNSRLPIATLWRKKANCRKLGICKWFPKPPSPTTTSLTGREVNFPIIYNASSGTFSQIVLAFTSSPDFLSDEDIKFYIDEDFELSVTSDMNLPFQILKIQEDIIDYDSSIGHYGGYAISIIGTN